MIRTDEIKTTPTGEIVVIPNGFPQIDIPRNILEDMTKAEVAKVVDAALRGADALAAWNDQRPEPTPRPGYYDGVPPPKSMAEYDWRVRTINGR